MIGEGRIKDCWLLGVRGYNNTLEPDWMDISLVANVSKNRMNKNVDFCVINALIIFMVQF